MLTDAEIEKIVREKIAAEVDTGEQVGGSGHLGYVSFELNEHTVEPLDGGAAAVTYSYTVFVETEFTVYPDNPPMESRYRVRLVLDAGGQIVTEEALPSESEIPFPLPEDLAWEEAQSGILAILATILSRIEWVYGDNRAPFKFPPTFLRSTRDDGATEYTCKVALDFGDEGELIYSSTSLDDLASELRADLTRRFLPDTPE